MQGLWVGVGPCGQHLGLPAGPSSQLGHWLLQAHKPRPPGPTDTPEGAQHRPGPRAPLPAGGSRHLRQERSPRAFGGAPAVGVEASPSRGHSFRSPPPAQGHPPVARSFPPPCSCWEWRLHFSCHLHSQSIRTPQLSRLAELGGRRRRNGSSGGCRLGAAPIRPRLLPAPPCAAGEGAEPLEVLLPPLGTRRAENGRGWRAGPAGPASPRVLPAHRHRRGAGVGAKSAALASPEPALLPRPSRLRLRSHLIAAAALARSGDQAKRPGFG